MIPLRRAMARAVVVGPDRAEAAWLAEAQRILLPGRRLVVERDDVTPPAGLTQVASGQGLLVAERRLSALDRRSRGIGLGVHAVDQILAVLLDLAPLDLERG